MEAMEECLIRITTTLVVMPLRSRTHYIHATATAEAEATEVAVRRTRTSLRHDKVARDD